MADQQSYVTALKLALRENERGEPLSIGLIANAADVAERAADLDVPVEIATDQASARDPLRCAPSGLTPDESAPLRQRDPKE